MNPESQPGKTILVVEDDTIVQEAMKMVLEWEGYDVACAANGRDALDFLRTRERPSLILLDLMMPVLDGWQFRREQKEDPALASIPVVAVSALDAAASFDGAGYVRKPFQVEEVLGVERVGVNDDFFALGGNSLLIARVGSRLCAAYGVDLPLHSLFTFPTVAGVSNTIEISEPD